MASRLNYLVGYDQFMAGQKTATAIQRLIASQLLSSAENASLANRFGSEWSATRALFSRHQVAVMLRLAARARPRRSGQSFGTAESRQRLGTACLIINDHLATAGQLRALAAPKLEVRKRNLALQLAFFLEFYNPLPLPEALARSENLLSGVPGVTGRSGIIRHLVAGLKRPFQEATGLTLNDYRDLILVVLFRYLSTNLQEVLEQPDRLMFHHQA